MELDPDDCQRERFDRLKAAFDTARAAHRSGVVEADCRFAGAPVRIRIAGRALAEQIGRVLVPASGRPGAGTAPALTIDVWDVCETGVQGLPAAMSHVADRRWQSPHGTFAASTDGRLVSHELRGCVAWIDRSAPRIIGWWSDARASILGQRAKPLQVPIAIWAHDRGVQAVHAAAVASDGRGVLIPGASGMGKSTVALSCLDAGYDYLGDDWVGIDHQADGRIVAHPLYTSALLDLTHLWRFPILQLQAIVPPDPSDRKSLVPLAALFPERLGRSAILRALALLRIADHTRAEWRPASKGEALRMLAPSSIATIRPFSGREGFERLVQLVERLPAYWLEIGSALDDIPQRMTEILAHAERA